MVVTVFTMGSSKGFVRKCLPVTQKLYGHAHLN